MSACETLPSEGPANSVTTVQSEDTSITDRTYELVNRSEVVATVKSKAIAVDLERQALEWGYTLKKQEKLDGLNLYLLTFDCPPGVEPRNAALELERLKPES